MTRDEIQDKAVDLSFKYKNLLLSFCTGLGKTFSFIKIQEALKAERTLICVSEQAHIQTWTNEYIKHNKEYLLEKTTIICYASLHKVANKDFQLVGLDEAHRITELRSEYLDTIKFKHLVSLTATIGEDNKATLEELGGKCHEFKVSLKQAISWGIIAKPIIYLVSLKLDNKVRNHTIVMVRGTGDPIEVKCLYPQRWIYLRDKVKYPCVKLIVSCTELEKYTYLTDQGNIFKSKYMRNRVEFFKVRWLKYGNDRKKFLSELKTKTAKKIANKLRAKNRRFICFCGSVEQADLLGKDNALHTYKDNPQEIIDRFNSKEIDSLYVVNMIQEGANLVDIDSGLIIQLDSAERTFIQRSGRVLRNENDPDIYIIYFEGTRDEEYLNNALEEVDKSYIRKLIL